jgi:hypothetical protein
MNTTINRGNGVRYLVTYIIYINVREYRKDNQKWTIQRNWQQDEEKQSKNTTLCVLDTTMRKQKQ